MRLTKKVPLSIAALIVLLGTVTSAMLYSGLRAPTDYSLLVEFIKLKDKGAPLCVFEDFEEKCGETSHRASLEYLNNHPKLIKRIQTDLGGKAIRWRLDYISHRLLFVPEQREEYASLYEHYCSDVIKDLLEKTGLNNPYRTIRTLRDEKPEISDSSDGIEVFLVHNLADEFTARYIFFNQQNKKVKIGLRGKVFVGEVGSYTTHIYQRQDGRFEFTRDNYTIWQNSANNPYTALMTPLEETLHIVLREYTEWAIKNSLKLNSIKSMKEVKRIANDWMAIEEAIVGSVGFALFPFILKKYINELPDAWIEEDLEVKGKFKRYRYIKEGIEIVKDLGYQKVLKMYMERPQKFEGLLGHNWITTTQRYCKVSNLKVQRDYFKAMAVILERSAQPSSSPILNPG